MSLNGISTEAGATVYSGSIITTGHDGIASIDLGPIGRFVVRPRTTITVTLGPGSARISDRAKATRINVLRGEVIVSAAGANRTLKSGDDAVFADSVEATMTGDTVFTIQDQGTSKDQGQKDPGAQNPNTPLPTPSPSPSPRRKNAVIVPWWGWLGMAGAAGGIAAGIATHGGERSSTNRVSSSLP
jgi:ferric-dicitrate binding protein FerR (iron transport regulator)